MGAATCAFLLLHAIPGDTAEALAGPQAIVEDVDNLRRAMELDQPLGKQYISYMGNLLHGDLGYSYRTNKPVMDILKSAWPATLQLAVCSMIVAVLLGVPIGIFAAIHRGKAGDTIAMIAAFLGVSMPSFWLALLLIIEFSVNHNWFPFYGREGISSFVLPSLTLGLGVAANIARLTRTSMLEVLGQDYIRTAKGKGVKSGKIMMGARAEERGGSGGHHHRPSVRSAAGRSGGDRDCIFLAGYRQNDRGCAEYQRPADRAGWYFDSCGYVYYY